MRKNVIFLFSMVMMALMVGCGNHDKTPASVVDNSKETNTKHMKTIMIIDGGPRKNFNTASMLQKFAEGASSVSDQIEVKTVRLYDLDYKIQRCSDAHFGRDSTSRWPRTGITYLFW